MRFVGDLSEQFRCQGFGPTNNTGRNILIRIKNVINHAKNNLLCQIFAEQSNVKIIN